MTEPAVIGEAGDWGVLREEGKGGGQLGAGLGRAGLGQEGQPLGQELQANSVTYGMFHKLDMDPNLKGLNG